MIHISTQNHDCTYPLSGTIQNRPGPRKDTGIMGGFSKMRGGDGLPHPQTPSAGPSGPRPSAGPSGPRPSSAAAAADVMVKEEPEDEDEAAADEEYLPDEEYLGEEFGELSGGFGFFFVFCHQYTAYLINRPGFGPEMFANKCFVQP